MKNLADEVDRLQKLLAQDSRSIEFARLADYLLEMKKTDEAIEVCQKGLEQHPQYANAHFILGRCYFEIGDLDVAESEFNKTLLYDAEHINAHHYQANIMKKREWQNAHVLWVKRALAIDPMDSTALLMLDNFEVSKESEPELASETPTDTLVEEPSEASPEDQFTEIEKTFSESEEQPETELEQPESEFIVEEETIEMDEDFSDKDSETIEEISDEVETVSDEITEVKEIEEEEEKEEEKEEERSEDQDEKKYEFILDDIFKPERGEESTAVEEDISEIEEGIIEEPAEETVMQESQGTEETEGVTEMEGSQESEETVASLDEADATPEDINLEQESETQKNEPEMSTEEKEKIASKIFGDDDLVVEEYIDNDEDEEDDYFKDLVDDKEDTSPEPESEESLEESKETTSVEEFTSEEKIEGPHQEPSPESQPEPETTPKKDPIVTATLGEIYAAQGHFSKAIGVYEILLRKDPANEHYKTKVEDLKKRMEEEES